MFKPEIQIPVDDDFLDSAKAAGVDIEIPDVENSDADGIGGANYVPRLSCPAKDNKYYLKSGYGGVNLCILGNPLYTQGSCLANCVGYAWGRAYELLGKQPSLSRGNAENWWSYADGYKRGQEPRLGAIACWRKGQAGVASDGAGHVAVVEKIDGNKITLSNSGWGASAFYLTTYNKGGFSHGAYTFQGFIYIGDWDENKDVLAVDGYWGVATIKYTQQMLGTIVDGTVSRQPRSNKKYLPNAVVYSAKLGGGWVYKTFRSQFEGGSEMVKALQKLVGATQDGYCGYDTVKHIQLFLAKRGLYYDRIDGIMGANTVKGWQEYINSQYK